MAFLFLTFLCSSSLSYGSEKWGVKITDPSSPYKIKMGFRVQAIMQSAEDNEDLYLRRSRINLRADFKNLSYISLDIRNDNVNKGNNDQGRVEIGNAFYHLPINNNHHLRFFRAKVDMSRSQTSNSAKLVFLNRAQVVDYAADFISHNRRAPNIQINGHFNHRLSYQLFIGDSITGSAFKDSQGNSNAEITQTKFAYGGKIRLSPFKDWEDKSIKETYIGEGKHISLGAGYFRTPSIEYRVLANDFNLNRSLLNYEASFHYKGFNFIAEYFYLHGQVDSFNQNNIGSSKGYYFLTEYFIQKLKLAPFARYEKWNQFLQSTDNTQYGRTYGVNWYFNKNKIRFGISYNQIDNEQSGTKEELYQLYTMINI